MRMRPDFSSLRRAASSSAGSGICSPCTTSTETVPAVTFSPRIQAWRTARRNLVRSIWRSGSAAAKDFSAMRRSSG
ncbi:MAG: hypothetical protein DI563_31970 [Variovorax paradoxus]|uniref:Uncharacterized protein n=1 Tax=Variovorax paradoxus TaxID=34073 RepID=A0A2W5QFM8_VARPD|nr:MAG: hypothetical protein DI563_31970 [Variovorax paradoxus]